MTYKLRLSKHIDYRLTYTLYIRVTLVLFGIFVEFLALRSGHTLKVLAGFEESISHTGLLQPVLIQREDLIPTSIYYAMLFDTKGRPTLPEQKQRSRRGVRGEAVEREWKERREGKLGCQKRKT